MTTVDPARQEQAKQYARISRRLWLLSTVLSGAYAGAWLVFGWSTALRDRLNGMWPGFQNPWFSVLGFMVIFGGAMAILGLPLSYYEGFALPRRFGQSTQTLKDWVGDQAKGLLIGAPIGLILIELLYLALRVTGTWWWLWAAAGLLVFNVVLTNLAPLLIMPLFNRYVPLGVEHKELEARLMRLAERASTKVQGVYQYDMSRRTKSANAAVTGIGNTRRIIIGDTLLKEFTPDEVEAVLGPELGHQVHRDILLYLGFGAAVTLVGLFLASLAMNWTVAAFGFHGTSDIAAFPALAIILGAYAVLTMPIENAVSRWRESMADEYSLQATSKTEAFASAFARLANQNLGELEPERWVVAMFYTHPPLGQRIEMAKNWKPRAT